MTGFTIIGISIDIIYSWARMIIALGISIVFSLVVGIAAARNKRAESILIPLLDVFQSIPILGFFPLVILGVIALFPTAIGVNIAVIILIFTSMAWNIAFGVYEAVKSIPQDYIDLSNISNSSSWQRISSLYVPSSLSRIAYNVQTSWAVALFYLVSSEILTLGNQTYSVHEGIGYQIMEFYLVGDWTGYAYALISLVVAVIIWQVVFLREFSLWSERYKFREEPRGETKDPLLKFYSWVNHRSISKLFLMAHGRGVSRFTSSITRFKRGLKYSVLILIAIFAALEVGTAVSVGAQGISSIPSVSQILSDEEQVLVALAYSFLRVWYVYFITVAIFLPLGIAIGLHSKLYNTAVPVLEVVASIPGPALLPVFVRLFPGQAEVVAFLIILLGMDWYIVFNVMAGIRSMPQELVELGKEFQASRRSAWRNIYVPAALTAFVTGSITAIGAAWNTLIVAEYFSIQSSVGGKTVTTVLTQVGFGIGKTIETATNASPPNLTTLTLAIISMTALIVAFNLTIWRRVYHYVTRKYSYNR